MIFLVLKLSFAKYFKNIAGQIHNNKSELLSKLHSLDDNDINVGNITVKTESDKKNQQVLNPGGNSDEHDNCMVSKCLRTDCCLVARKEKNLGIRQWRRWKAS